ncbi:DUF7002 family protein [Rhizobium leguminosarum]|uniref:DUF7002 family protein n=1 Tax=Rhizobium leguminosarum TaxID=384 RepID=UPI003F9D5905
MNIDDLASIHPRLWHMAMDGSWPSIQQYGLLSTSALLDLYNVQGELRSQIESARRPRSVAIAAPGLPGAIVRDQKPMFESSLLKCLKDGIVPKQWYEILNEKVFFWPSRERLRRLLGARAYRSDPQLVLTIDTRSLLNAHKDLILLSPINSGSTIMSAQPRGKDTFLSIETYPFNDWKKKRGSSKTAIAELTVSNGVQDIMDHVLAAHRVYNGNTQEVWKSPKALADDGP